MTTTGVEPCGVIFQFGREVNQTHHGLVPFFADTTTLRAAISPTSTNHSNISPGGVDASTFEPHHHR